MADQAPKVVVVVPTIRSYDIQAFLTAWRFQVFDVSVIVVEDHPEPEFLLRVDGLDLTHLSHADIERDLGERAWIIPRRTDCVRSYGYYRAWQMHSDMIITLDDDCLPPADGPAAFLEEHWKALTLPGAAGAWVNTLENVVPRGIPYFERIRKRPVVLNHGLWTNVPDLDAVTQLGQERRRVAEAKPRQFTVPVGSYFPMCGMNLAFRPEAVPALYFLLMGQGEPYDRFGDIWSGVIFKHIADHLGYAVRSGEPHVEHRRASNVWANLRKEAPGLEVNETLWQAVDSVRLSGTTFGACYGEIAEHLTLEGAYWDRLRSAMRVWATLFDH